MNKDVLYEACNTLVEELKQTYHGWPGGRQFAGTANRLVRMYTDFCWSPQQISEEVEKQLKAFTAGYDEMLVNGPIRVHTLCPHHLLPCTFNVTIGYVPNGRVLGLSKFTRIARAMGKKPVMQEEYSSELATLLYERLEAKGVGVFVVGTHGCMTSRGVCSDSVVTTSNIKGVFETEPSTKAEFLSLARTK